MADIPLIKAKKTPQKDVELDKGFFVIEVDEKIEQIRVEYYSNIYKKGKIVSGKIEKIFVGKKAAALSDTITKYLPDLLPEHYCYLGRELQRAEESLKKGTKYIQDGC